jgi:hypothetical protein
MVKKGYDYIHLLSQEIDQTGSIMITVELDKIIQYPDVVEKYIVLYHLQKGEDKFNAIILKMPAGAKDFNIKYTENTYAETVNVFLSSLLQQQNVASENAAVFFYQVMVIADKDMNSLNQLELKNNKTKEYIKKQIAKDVPYAGNILVAHSNNKGNTTVINEDLLSKTDDNPNNAGYIGLTEYDHEGNEKWAAAIPKTRSGNATNDLPSSEVFKVRTSAYELSQVLCLNTKNSYYIIYNDLNNNFNKTAGNTLEAITDYGKTNAVCYQVNKKKEINKSYLFGPATETEYKQIYTHSGDFDTKNNVYATLLLSNKQGQKTTHIAWCKINN